MCSKFPTIRQKHEFVQWNSKKLISTFSFRISISPGQLLLISLLICISPFNKNLIFKIFPEHIVSLKPTKKWPPLICLYWPKQLSKEWLWKRAVSIKSNPSSNKSSVRLAWHLKIRIRALAVDRERVNCPNDGTLSSHQFPIQSASEWQNFGFPSSFFGRWSKMWFQNWTLELETIHHILKCLKILPHFFSQENI